MLLLLLLLLLQFDHLAKTLLLLFQSVRACASRNWIQIHKPRRTSQPSPNHQLTRIIVHHGAPPLAKRRRYHLHSDIKSTQSIEYVLCFVDCGRGINLPSNERHHSVSQMLRNIPFIWSTDDNSHPPTTIAGSDGFPEVTVHPEI